MSLSRRAALAALGGLALTPSRLAAQDRSPVALVVPFAAGGNTDVLARVLAQAMTADLGRADRC